MADRLKILVFATGAALTAGRTQALKEAFEREAENPRIWNRHPRHFSTEQGEFERNCDVVIVVGEQPEIVEAYEACDGVDVVQMDDPAEEDEDDEPEASQEDEEGEGEEPEEPEETDTEEEAESSEEGEGEEDEETDSEVETEEEIDTSDVSPAAAQLADEHGLDVDEITGTGKEGRVLVSDVRDAISEEG